MPLVISAPWLPQSVGLRSSSIVELVDIFPTTVALAGLKPPPGETLDGTSLAPLLSKPLPPGQSWDKVALSQYPRCPASADGETWTTNATLMWINKWVRPSDLTTRSSDAPLLPTAGASSRTASTSRGWASPCALPSSGAPPPPQHDSSTLCLALTLPIVRVCRSYTEWAQWDGATQRPNWSVLAGRERHVLTGLWTLVCVAITLYCYHRLYKAAIALACSGDEAGIWGGCNDEAIRAAEEEGLIKPVARTFEYVGGRVTDMPSGFFHKFPSFVENPSGGQR